MSVVSQSRIILWIFWLKNRISWKFFKPPSVCEECWMSHQITYLVTLTLLLLIFNGVTLVILIITKVTQKCSWLSILIEWAFKQHYWQCNARLIEKNTKFALKNFYKLRKARPHVCERKSLILKWKTPIGNKETKNILHFHFKLIVFCYYRWSDSPLLSLLVEM